MLLSIALIFLIGSCLGGICRKLTLPPLIGYLITGIVLGPYVMNLIDTTVLAISADLRQIALIIILLRAGLNLDLESLKKVGRPAVLMCFVPATLEMLGMLLIARPLLHLTALEALILGAVIAAVSPAVVVPHMLKLIDEEYGTEQGVPQLIMAGASIDDIYVIVLFTCFTGLAVSGNFDALNFLRIPTSIVSGVGVGALAGLLLCRLFEMIHMRDSRKVLLIMAMSMLLVVIERKMTGYFGFSGLLAIMAAGGAMRIKKRPLAVRIAAKLDRLWVAAEILLFTLVGAAANISYAMEAGPAVIAVLAFVLVFRMAGVYISTGGSSLNTKERFFCMLAYTPKATVQAAIGALPLSMGLSCGSIVLTAAVLAILITAPVGAAAIDFTYKKLLKRAVSTTTC